MGAKEGLLRSWPQPSSLGTHTEAGKGDFAQPWGILAGPPQKL